MKWWWSGCALLVLGVAGSFTKAGEEYEFVKDLVTVLEFEDLAERQIEKLLSSPEESARYEGVLARAFLFRRRATTGNLLAAEREKLLGEARQLYDKFLQEAGKKHRLFAEAEGEAATIDKDQATALLQAAQGEKPGSEKEKELKQKAITLLDKGAANLKAKAEKSFESAKELVKQLEKYDDRNKPPPTLLQKVQEAIEASIKDTQRHCDARLTQINALEVESEEAKRMAGELAQFIDKQLEVYPADYGVVIMVLNFFKGRAWAAAGNIEKASDAFKEAADAPIPREAQVRKYVDQVKRATFHAQTKMYLRKKMYKEAVATVDRYLFEYPDDVSLDVGKDCLLEKARALALQDHPDYTEALEAVIEVVRGGGRWAINARLAMAEIMNLARKEGFPIKLSAKAWYDAANGSYCMGRMAMREALAAEKRRDPAGAAEKTQEANRHLDAAIDSYRRAIAACRDPGLPLRARLSTWLEVTPEKKKQLHLVEPDCWLEMGLAYYWRDHLYEAALAWQACKNTFARKSRTAPDNREKLARNESDLAWLRSPQQKHLHEELDRYVELCERYLMAAITRRKNQTRLLSDQRIAAAVMEETGEARGGEAYSQAQNEYEVGLTMNEAGRQALAGGRQPSAYDYFRKALTHWTEAEKAFAHLGPADEYYPDAQYMRGACLHAIFRLYQSNHVQDHSGKALPEGQRRGETLRLAKEILAKFAQFEQTVKDQPSVNPETKKRRQRLLGSVMMYRPSIYKELGEWDKAIKECDRYLAYLQTHEDVDRSELPRVYQIKVFVILQKAKDLEAGERPGVLELAEQTTEKLRELHPEMFRWAAYNLYQLWDASAQQWRLNPQNDPRLAQEWDLRAADWFITWLEHKYGEDLSEDKEGNKPTLTELIIPGEKYYQAQKWLRAAQFFERVLKVMDPQGKNYRTDNQTIFKKWLLPMISPPAPDKRPLIWLESADESEAARAMAIFMYDLMADDRENRERNPQDSPAAAEVREILKNLTKENPTLLDPRHGITKLYKTTEVVAKVARWDWFDFDNHKALLVHGEILRRWGRQKNPRNTGFLADHPEAGREGKSLLELFEEESRFRANALGVRDRLADCYLQHAEKLELEKKTEEAGQYFKKTGDALKSLLEVMGNVPDMKLKNARCYLAGGEPDKALEIYGEVKNQARQERDKYWWASGKGISLCFFAKAKAAKAEGKKKEADEFFSNAAQFPRYLANTFPLDRIEDDPERWPGIRKYMEALVAEAEGAVKASWFEKQKITVTGVPDYYYIRSPDELALLRKVKQKQGLLRAGFEDKWTDGDQEELKRLLERVNAERASAGRSLLDEWGREVPLKEERPHEEKKP